MRVAATLPDAALQRPNPIPAGLDLPRRDQGDDDRMVAVCPHFFIRAHHPLGTFRRPGERGGGLGETTIYGPAQAGL